MREEVVNIDFGQWVKEKRKAAGYNQHELARLIPIHENTLSRYETGDKSPALDVAERICEIFGAELLIKVYGREDS